MTPISMHRNVQIVKDHVATPARVLFSKMIERAERNVGYRDELLDWLEGRSSTVALRDLAKPFADYWGNLKDANKIDDLDSAILKVR